MRGELIIYAGSRSRLNVSLHLVFRMRQLSSHKRENYFSDALIKKVGKKWKTVTVYYPEPS